MKKDESERIGESDAEICLKVSGEMYGCGNWWGCVGNRNSSGNYSC